MGLITRDVYVEWNAFKWFWRTVTVWRVFGFPIVVRSGGWRTKSGLPL